METKICNKCKKEKSINEFYKDKNKKDNLTSRCKKCISEYYPNNYEKVKERNKEWQKNNPEKVIAKNEYSKKYHKKHKDQHKKSGIKYKETHKNEIKEYFKKYWQDHKNEAKKYSKNYRENNPERIKENLGKFRKNNPDYDKKRQRKRRENSTYRLNNNISSAIWGSLKNGKGGRHWETLVEFTFDELKRHLEAQFKDKMTWDNYGKWHIDHKIPISLFNITGIKSKGFKKAWKLENLQPLWAKENILKSNKLFY